jgi:diguanylate cyclase (GGDEF)-like protein
MLKSKKEKTERLNIALKDRLNRYRSLREIGESFSAKLSLDEIYCLGTETAYNVIPYSDAALLFMIDEQKQQLLLSASRIAGELPRIKSKNGDIFDEWVFKERQPLNVADVSEDFRFDYKPLPGDRPFTSLISVPLISPNRIIGIFRLNSQKKEAYTFDDLRLLDFVSDLVSSAVNNARLYKTTEELSIKDSLTGLYVHRYLKQRMAEEAKRSRLTKAPFSLIMVDIDHFKDYNDKYGHSAGDKVLIGIANIMQESTKDGYIIARYGGEEFVILMPNSDKEKARGLAEQIKKTVSSRSFILRREETRVTISAGVVSYSSDIKDEDEMLKRADFCLYKAKKEGRNRVCVA